MHATCMSARNVEASLSYLMVILLRDFSRAKNLSTTLLTRLYSSSSNLYGLPRLGLRLFLGFKGMFAFMPHPSGMLLSSLNRTQNQRKAP